MAAAEARAVWQRTRCFIQDDAKRAPKLACCPSNSSLLPKLDTKPVNSTDLNDSFPLLDEKSSYSNLSSDSKWWTQLQPDYMCQRGLTSEHVNPLDSQNSHQFVENQDVNSINSLSKESFEFVEMDSVQLPWWQMAEKDNLASFVSKKSHNFIENCSQNAISNVVKTPIREVDSSKSKILEALCHSQTRARKAEIAAKKAYAEKEDVIKLLFRQASQLFAYRQWIYLLQLENIYYQIKNKKSDPISSVLPISPSKIGKLHKNLKKVAPAKGKRTRNKHEVGRFEHDLGKYAVVFVVGLGIIGAGMLLGWTVGWMLI